MCEQVVEYSTKPRLSLQYRLVRSVATILQHWVAECSELNMERKPFLVHSVPTTFIAYCNLLQTPL